MCFLSSHPGVAFPSDQGHRNLKKEKGSTKKKRKKEIQHCASRMSVLPTDLITKIFLPHPFLYLSLLFFALYYLRIFSETFCFLCQKTACMLLELILAFCRTSWSFSAKRTFNYLQVLVGSHEAWGVSLVPGKQTQAASAIPDTWSERSGGPCLLAKDAAVMSLVPKISLKQNLGIAV